MINIGILARHRRRGGGGIVPAQLHFSSLSPTTAVQGASSSWTFYTNNGNTTTVPVFSVPGDFTVSALDYTDIGLGFFTATVAVGAGATIGTDTVKLHDTSATLTDSPTLNISVVVPATPTFTSISPTSIAQNTSGTFSLVGTNLNNTQILASLPSGVSSGNLVCSSSTAATVTLSASASAPITTGTARISDPVNGTSGTQVLSVTAGTPSGTARTSMKFTSVAQATHPSASKTVALASLAGPSIGSWRNLGQVNGGTGGTNWTADALSGSPQKLPFMGAVSAALSEQIIPSGTYTFDINLSSDTAGALTAAPVMYVWRPSTDAVVQMIHDSATGIGSVTTNSNTTAGKVFTVNVPTAFAIQNGDCLVIEMYGVGGPNGFSYFGYDGNGSAPVEGGAETFVSTIAFPSAIYTAPTPLGTLRVGPSGISSSTSSPSIAPIVVTSDADLRSKLLPSGGSSYVWDSTQTSKLGTATPSTTLVIPSSVLTPDLMALDTIRTFTDRDAVVRNTLLLTIKPNGGAPLSSANDSIAASSQVPQGAFALPLGMRYGSWMTRQLFRFVPGFRMDAPNNTVSNASGFNSTQSGAYKIGPHPGNDVTRADFELTGGQNPGSEYLTANFGDFTTVDDNYIVGSLSSIMPGWNTNGDVWEVVRVHRIVDASNAKEAVYIGKLTDTHLTKQALQARILDTTRQSAWNTMNYCGFIGKNFNRQLASTDTFPQVNVSDVEFSDITDPAFVWPPQIQVADRI